MARKQNKRNNPAGLLVALLMLLLVVIAVFIVIRSLSDRGTPETVPSSNVTEPAGGQETPEATPAPTETPEPTPTPTATPEPTPEDTPVPDSSGSFRSDTGTGLNLVVDWEARDAGGGDVSITFNVYAESYSLYSSECWNGVTVTLAGKDHSFTTSAISCDANRLTKSPLGSVTVVTAADSSIPVSARWSFGGTYGGTELPTLTASGTVTLG